MKHIDRPMRCGCIGEHLTHSFSKDIHARLASYAYELLELAPHALDAFMIKAPFDAINVTIPYKSAVIPYLSHIDAAAEAIGAVNTIVKREDGLWGYNTDVYGMTELLAHAGVSIQGKKVLILGTGGTSKTACAVARAEGASCVLRVSRDGREGAITYAQAYQAHTDAQVLINTTPCGMYPTWEACPIDIDRFPALTGVIDAIYNPLCTKLVLAARARGIAAEGGLYMLVAQAVRASEIFLGEDYPAGTTERIYRDLLRQKQNIVLIGMPSCGKTTVGTHLAERMQRPLLDTDACIIERAGTPIPTIFATQGEAAFRAMEQQVVRDIATQTGHIIATGGGAVLREDNIQALRANGRLYFLDRPLSKLLPTEDRPLSGNAQALRLRYHERYDLYCRCADVIVDASTDAEVIADFIQGEFST